MQFSHIKKIAITLALIVLPLALCAAGYAFVWWKVNQAADIFAKDISPFAKLSYKTVHIDLFETRVGLKDISLTPAGSSGDIQIREVMFKVPSWQQAIALQGQLNRGELPEAFQVDVKGIGIDFNSGYIQDWGRIVHETQRNAGPSYDALACGKLAFIGLPEMREMGYKKLQSDLAFQYRFNPSAKQLTLDMQSQTNGMASLSASLRVKVAADTLNMQSLVFSQPQLQRLEARYSDRGYNRRRNNYCAKLNEESLDSYQQRYQALLEKRLVYEGWQIPTAVLNAFYGMQKGGSSIYVRLNTPNGFGIQNLALVKTPEDLVTQLKPHVEINKAKVDLTGITWQEPDPEGQRLLQELMEQQSEMVLGDEVELAEPEAETEGTAPASRITPYKKKNKAVVVVVKKSFKEVPVSALAGHLGKPVIIYTYFGRKVEGRLIGYTEKVVTVEHRPSDGRGTATYPMDADKIQSARLYH